MEGSGSSIYQQPSMSFVVVGRHRDLLLTPRPSSSELGHSVALDGDSWLVVVVFLGSVGFVRGLCMGYIYSVAFFSS